jgi:fatty-acyl-CoA synthase
LGPDGYIRLVDRIKDMIKSGGEWISSIDLENAAMRHPAVAEAAAFARPDKKWGERPVLAVRLRDGAKATQADIVGLLAAEFAKWALPDEVLFLDDLPHTATGKVAKRVLRERLSTVAQA